MAETLPGWSAPVYSGLAEPPMFKGVPLMFFGADVLGSLFLAVCLVQIEPVYSVLTVLAGLVLYGIVFVGMKIEPRWWRILCEYVGYATFYEG